MFGEFEIFDISKSALSAERKRMHLIANNIANINTTRGVDGKPYRRKYAVFETILDNEMSSEEGGLNEKGVRVAQVEEDKSPYIKVYDPNHPDADENGYVSYPNINVAEEMVDLVSASRAYEANIAVLKSTKTMILKLLELLKI